MIIRPIRLTDLDGLMRLAESASVGLTNLPKNREVLKRKIEESLEAFAKNIDSPHHEKYMFVLENPETKEIGGTCGIFSQTGVTFPLYYYQIQKLELKHEPLNIQILKAVSRTHDLSEIAALYLHPDFRKSGVGKLLSFSRFLFIAAFKKRFKRSFFAEIRGVIDENHVSPFWEGVGRHFFDLDFEKLMKFAENGRGFIPDILPKHPIYIQLLPKEVQEVIGKPHEKSMAALSMLSSQGFAFNNEIDLFEGGPRVVAKTSNIKIIRESVLGKVSEVKDEVVGERYLMSNERIDFRAALGCLEVAGKNVVLDKETAKALEIKLGDKVRYWGLD